MISHSVSHGIPDGLLKRACAFHHAAFFACSFRNTIFTAKSGFAAATAKPGMCAGVRFFFSVSGSIIALKRSPNTCRWAVAGQQVSTPGFPKRQHQRAPRSCCSLRTMVARLGASYFEKWPMTPSGFLLLRSTRLCCCDGEPRRTDAGPRAGCVGGPGTRSPHAAPGLLRSTHGGQGRQRHILQQRRCGGSEESGTVTLAKHASVRSGRCTELCPAQ